MLTANIREDCFFLASLSPDVARGLCPPGLTPVLAGGDAWMSVAAVRLEGVRLLGVPAARRAVCAASLLLVEHGDAPGGSRRGNYFLAGFTTSRSLCRATRLLGADLFRHAPIALVGDARSIHLDVPGKFAARMDRERRASGAAQGRMEQLFDDNRQGVVRSRGGVFRVPLEKSHWEVRGREACVEHGGLFDDLGARFRFAFDTSDATGRWRRPRRLQSSDPSVEVSRSGRVAAA